MHWLASNASRDADSCLMLGLVHQVVDEDCDPAAMVRAERVAETQSGSGTFCTSYQTWINLTCH
jgi:enoyl-CoA hydratase/carnithine racemase